MTGDTWACETGEKGIAAELTLMTSVVPGDEVAGSRADAGARLGTVVWECWGLLGINPADRNYLAWDDLLG